MRDFDHLMIDLKARGVYTIARISRSRQRPRHRRPDLRSPTGARASPGRPREPRLGRSVPEEVWAYNIAIAKEAVPPRFDEVQFDYVRFPTDGKLGAARYSRQITRTRGCRRSAGFLERAADSSARPAPSWRRYLRLHRVQRRTTPTSGSDRGAGAPPRLHLPHGLPVGYHLGIPGFRNPVTTRTRSCARASGSPERSGHAVARCDRGSRLPGLRLRPTRVRRDSGAGSGTRRSTRPAAPAGFALEPAHDYTGAALKPKGGLAASGAGHASLTDEAVRRAVLALVLSAAPPGPSARPERARPRDDPRVPQAAEPENRWTRTPLTSGTISRRSTRRVPADRAQTI